MADETTAAPLASPAAPAATPPATLPGPRAVPPTRGRRVPAPLPSGPSVAGGRPLTSGRRVAVPAGLPPGIPEDLAGHIQTEGSAPAAAGAASSSVPRHPLFAPLPQARTELRQLAESLRNQLMRSAGTNEQLLAAIDTFLAKASDDEAKAVMEAENIDLSHLQQFRAALAKLVEMTQAEAV